MEQGRQGTGYQKLYVKDNINLLALLESSKILLGIDPTNEFWDAYLLYYPTGAFIPKHRDEASVVGMKHYRLNALVTLPKNGGIFIADDEVVNWDIGDAVLFKPDCVIHEVTRIEDGERLVWSVGCWKNV